MTNYSYSFNKCLWSQAWKRGSWWMGVASNEERATSGVATLPTVCLPVPSGGCTEDSRPEVGSGPSLGGGVCRVGPQQIVLDVPEGNHEPMGIDNRLQWSPGSPVLFNVRTGWYTRCGRWGLASCMAP